MNHTAPVTLNEYEGDCRRPCPRCGASSQGLDLSHVGESGIVFMCDPCDDTWSAPLSDEVRAKYPEVPA